MSVGGGTVERGRARLPVVGILVAVFSAALMGWFSWSAWPDLPEMVHGGRTNLDGTPNMVPRAVLALILPLTTVFLAVVLSVGMLVGQSLHTALNLQGASTARSTSRTMNVVLALMSLFLLVAHGALVLGQAGWDVQTGRVMGVLTGVLLVAIGVLVPRPEPRDGHDTALVRWWTAAYRPMMVAIALVGLVQVAVVLLVDHQLVWVLPPLLLIPAMCAAMVWPTWRNRG